MGIRNGGKIMNLLKIIEIKNVYDFIFHKDDGPAFIYPDRYQEWCQHNELHRNNDKPAVIWDDGEQEWWEHGIFVKEESIL